MPDLDKTGTVRSALMRRFRWYYFGDTDLINKQDIVDILSIIEKQRLVGSSIEKPSIILTYLVSLNSPDNFESGKHNYIKIRTNLIEIF